jgi:ribosome-associated protein
MCVTAPTAELVGGGHRPHRRVRGLRAGQNGDVPLPILDVPLSGDPIRVGQFLKLAGLAEHGAHAKELLAAGEVQVNGRVETRRGARLRTGDVVAVQGRRARPVGPPAG